MEALKLYAQDPAAALELLTSLAEARAERVVKDEFALFGELMVKYRGRARLASRLPSSSLCPCVLLSLHSASPSRRSVRVSRPLRLLVGRGAAL